MAKLQKSEETDDDKEVVPVPETPPIDAVEKPLRNSRGRKILTDDQKEALRNKPQFAKLQEANKIKREEMAVFKEQRVKEKEEMKKIVEEKMEQKLIKNVAKKLIKKTIETIKPVDDADDSSSEDDMPPTPPPKKPSRKVVNHVYTPAKIQRQIIFH